MITVILLEPQNAGNIGAVCRAMKNFGFSKLVLVKPKCKPLSLEARKRAKHAVEILHKARIIKKSELRSFDYLIGTTGALGTDYNIPRSPIRPEELSQILTGKKRNIGENIGILFGPEGTGLSNKEILKCDFIVTIPTSKKYPAMNLSHSVAIVLYELFKKSGKKKIDSHIKPATRKEKEVLMDYIEKILGKMEFQTPEKKDTQRKIWKRIIGKSFMTKREAFALIGFLKKIGKL